jgi:hypothetical protein
MENVQNRPGGIDKGTGSMTGGRRVRVEENAA